MIKLCHRAIVASHWDSKSQINIKPRTIPNYLFLSRTWMERCANPARFYGAAGTISSLPPHGRLDRSRLIAMRPSLVLSYRSIVPLVRATYLHGESSSRQIFLGDSHSNLRFSFLLENNAFLYAALSQRRALSEELSFSAAGGEKGQFCIIVLYPERRESSPVLTKIASSAGNRIIPHAIEGRTRPENLLLSFRDREDNVSLCIYKKESPWEPIYELIYVRERQTCCSLSKEIHNKILSGLLLLYPLWRTTNDRSFLSA